MPSYGMHLEPRPINLKVQPIKHKTLDQSQDRLPEKRIEAHLARILEDERDDTIPQHQRDEGARPLDLVLDVDGRVELEHPRESLSHLGVARPAVSEHGHVDHAPEEIDGDGYEDGDQATRGVGQGGGSDPESGGYQNVQDVAYHGAPDERDQDGGREAGEGHEEPGCEVERY